jgi:hypothetical protein
MILTLRHGVHNYAEAIMPGWVVIGFGLGFTVPTIIGSATVDLPPEVSGSQMYHYFPDKNELVQAVIDYQAETIVKHHRKALGNVTCAPSARELPTRGLHG